MNSPKTHDERVDMLKNTPLVPYTCTGEYDWEIFSFTRVLHAHYKDEPWYVGFISGWSRTRWYANKNSSDFDVSFIGGTPLIIDQEARQESVKTFGEKMWIQAHLLDQYTESFFRGNFQAEGRSSWGHALHVLLRPIIGIPEKIHWLRRLARRRILASAENGADFLQEQISMAMYHLLDDDFGGIQWYILDHFTTFHAPWQTINEFAVSVEQRTLKKMLQRWFSPTDIDAIFESRKRMWRTRIQHLIDGTGPFNHVSQ